MFNLKFLKLKLAKLLPFIFLKIEGFWVYCLFKINFKAQFTGFTKIFFKQKKTFLAKRIAILWVIVFSLTVFNQSLPVQAKNQDLLKLGSSKQILVLNSEQRILQKNNKIFTCQNTNLFRCLVKKNINFFLNFFKQKSLTKRVNTSQIGSLGNTSTATSVASTSSKSTADLGKYKISELSSCTEDSAGIRCSKAIVGGNEVDVTKDKCPQIADKSTNNACIISSDNVKKQNFKVDNGKIATTNGRNVDTLLIPVNIPSSSDVGRYECPQARMEIDITNIAKPGKFFPIIPSECALESQNLKGQTILVPRPLSLAIIPDILIRSFSLIASATFYLFFFMLVLSGIQIMWDAIDGQQKARAIKNLQDNITALVLIVATYGIILAIINFLKFDTANTDVKSFFN